MMLEVKVTVCYETHMKYINASNHHAEYLNVKLGSKYSNR